MLTLLSPALATPSSAFSTTSAGPSVGLPVVPRPQPSKHSDVRLAVIASASALFSVLGFVAGLTGLLPSGICTLIVLIGVSIGLRVLWSYAARSASTSSRARMLQMVSNVGLVISALSIMVGLPRITRAAGMQTFLVDLLAEFWTMAILTVVASHVRTFNWRVFSGAGLTGFLAITSLARFVGVPLVQRLGLQSGFAVALWVPFTEELFKMIPVLVVLMVALRHAHVRPSAMDLTLLGAWTGAGFATYENAILGRGHFSLIMPSQVVGRAFGWPIVQTGHLCHTALISLSVALAFLYYQKTRRLKWLVPLVAIFIVLLEHCSQNGIAVNGLNGTVAKLTILLTLGGWLSSVLLIAGIGFSVMLEWRILGGSFQPAGLAKLSPAEAFRRSTLLARAQTGAAL
jgi:RsiW-degrading membrane proteinase PrsW (M82 family)